MTLELAHVGFRYAAGDRLALNDVHLALGKPGLTLVTGPLGAGATTLLLVAAGLAPRLTGGQRSGSVSLLGVDPATPQGHAALAGRVAILRSTPWTQLSGIAPTVWEEIAFGPANLGWTSERIGDAVSDAAGRLEVQHLLNRDPATLSGGELQRVVLAALVAMRPAVYLLDEPAGELDPRSAERLYRLLPELASAAAVVVATADVDRAAAIAQRAVVLAQGKVVADGAPEVVLTREAAFAECLAPSPAVIARDAGFPTPYPLTAEAAIAAWSR